jgi:hypothetical protein
MKIEIIYKEKFRNLDQPTTRCLLAPARRLARPLGLLELMPWS